MCSASRWRLPSSTSRHHAWITDQDASKAEILVNSGMPDDDGVSFIIVTDESDAVTP